MKIRLPDFKLTYHAPRPFPDNWRFFSLIVYVIAAIFFILLVILNSALVGYETLPIQSSFFETTRVNRFKFRSGGSNCVGVFMGPGESFNFGNTIFQWRLVSTNSTFLSKFIYSGSPLQCFILYQHLVLQESSADLSTVIQCHVGIKSSTQITAEMSISRSVFSQVVDKRKVSYYDPKANAIEEKLQYAWLDLISCWREALNGPIPYPIMVSADILPSVNCAHASGEASQCAMEVPQVIDIHPTFLVFNGSGRSSDTTFPDNSTIHLAISNFAQFAFAAIRIDLGQVYPNNPLLNLSVINETLHSKLGSVDSLLYANLTQPGKLGYGYSPATIVKFYPCTEQFPKPIGSAIISVLVATLSMFTTGWGIFMFISSSFAERVRGRKEAAEQELMIPKGEVATET